MPEISQFLSAAAAGDRQAAADLLPLVYDELRKLAAARMAAEVSVRRSHPAHQLPSAQGFCATGIPPRDIVTLHGDTGLDGSLTGSRHWS
jgi:hypothetical protein